ncbi:MAG: sulfatase-like hydrolase/transferase [Xanthomonadales bacterium]|nr:sulfatase-like hydrolase/transferase [Xanthomonadales bacterium]
MSPVKTKLQLFLLPLALCGFAIAQPVYNLLLQTPVFLVARQNTLADVWALVLLLSFVLPGVLVLPAWLTYRRWPVFSSRWCWAISSIFAALFVAQLLQASVGAFWLLYIGLASVSGITISWFLLFSRWSILGTVLAALAVLFPFWFLLFSPVLNQVDNYAAVPTDRKTTDRPLPDIVFVLLDELPMATLVDDQGQVDGSLFPGFARLQSISNWYFNTTSVSDGTTGAVPAILTSRYPGKTSLGLTVAEQPVNLFTILRHHYGYNVVEAVTRFCPQALCPRVGPGIYSRIKALLLDMAAIYLHRVVPDRWVSSLPVVTNNWSGFFAERQVFFPEGWLKHAGAQTVIDRPEFFNQFTSSIRKDDKPILNFMHILFPHGPTAYLPSGENYGFTWMRGQFKEIWGDVEWGLISGKQRHFLQVQYADRLLNNLLDHLQEERMLDESLVVVVADHGISFALNESRRALSDTNHAALLRVPLFIKLPKQLHGQRFNRPAMTIDILPTILAALGFSSDSLELDGVDLGAPSSTPRRQRQANSQLDPALKNLDEADLDIDKLVIENRRQLKLNEPGRALWEIGPYDSFRGQALETVCEKSAVSIKVNFEKFSELPNTNPQDSLPAYVVGTFSGEAVDTDSKPFLITSSGVVVASGHTWAWDIRPIFFALVEPKYVKQEGWDPKAWLLEDDLCLGEIE